MISLKIWLVEFRLFYSIYSSIYSTGHWPFTYKITYRVVRNYSRHLFWNYSVKNRLLIKLQNTKLVSIFLFLSVFSTFYKPRYSFAYLDKEKTFSATGYLNIFHVDEFQLLFVKKKLSTLLWYILVTSYLKLELDCRYRQVLSYTVSL